MTDNRVYEDVKSLLIENKIEKWLVDLVEETFANKVATEKMSDDVSTELDTVIPRHQLLDNTAAKHKTDLIHRFLTTWTFLRVKLVFKS